MQSCCFAASSFSFKPPIIPPRSVGYVPFAFLGTLINLPFIYKTLGLNIKYVLLSRETSISHEPLISGDCVSLVTYLKDAYEQQASSTPIGFCILHTFGFKSHNLAFFNEKVLAIRGGFERRK